MLTGSQCSRAGLEVETEGEREREREREREADVSQSYLAPLSGQQGMKNI